MNTDCSDFCFLIVLFIVNYFPKHLALLDGIISIDKSHSVDSQIDEIHLYIYLISIKANAVTNFTRFIQIPVTHRPRSEQAILPCY